jgi:uncharacterized OB-fold protein
MTDEKTTVKKSIPIREGIFHMPSRPGEKPYLFGSRCKACAEISFPPRKFCSKCFSDQMEAIPLSSRGQLYSYTIIGYPPPGLQAPYAIGYVDLPEGVRVFSIITDWDQQSLKVGANVELTIGKFKEDKDGNEIVTYKFSPAKA